MRKARLPRFAVIATATALVLAGSLATASPASASLATTPPAYNNATTADPASIGHIALYDASGDQVVGGSLNNLGGAIYAVASSAPRAGATKAQLLVAAPDHTTPSSDWVTQPLSAAPSFPVAAGTSVPTVVSGASGPVVTLNGTTNGDVASFLSTATLDPASGYDGYAQLRITDVGTGLAAATTWATTEIAIDIGAGTWTQVFPAAPSPASTTTTVTVTPANQTVAFGAMTGPFVATAAIEPAGANGTVQFKVDGVNSGSPVTVSSGSATATLTSLSSTCGSTSATSFVVTGVFTASTPSAGHVGFANSASTNTVVNAQFSCPPGNPGTVNLMLSSANVSRGINTLTATASVTDTNSPSTPVTTGSFQFMVDGAMAGSAVSVSSSGVASATIATASLTSSASPGTSHTVTALYSGGSTIANTSSSEATFNLIEPTAAELQYIQTSIAAGTLDLTTALNVGTPLLLPAMTLNTAVDEYQSTLAIGGLSMTDTRPGNLPYTLSLLSTNLTKVGVANPSENESISAQNVGFDLASLVSTNATPSTFLGSQAPGASTAGQNFTGFNNVAANHVQVTDAGSLGLGGATPHPILHANQGLGTTVVAATMTIRAPTNLVDGTYAGTVTFSVLGS